MKLQGAVSRHKQQLEALRERDPEFYAYLQQTDAELLGFGEDDESDLEDESEDEDHDEAPAAAAGKAGKPAKAAAAAGKDGKAGKADKKAAAAAAAAANEAEEGDESEEPHSEEEEEGGAGKQGMHVTSSMVDGWCKAALEKASMGAMMQLIKAYRVACHYGDTEQQLSSSLTISSGAVFNRVMLFMLKEADGIFRRMLGLPQDASSAAAAAAGGSGAAAAGKPGVLLAEAVPKAPRWRKVEPLVKSYLGNSLHLLASMTQPEMSAYALRRLRPSAAFFGPYPRLTKKLLKLGLELFGSGEKENAPRLQALLLVRQMGLVLPPPALQTVLRGAYRAYAANAKFVSPATLPALAFMAAGVVELSSLDLAVTYQVGFVAIRELAVLLRNALSAKTQDAHKEVYCWQTLNCLELWVKVLAAAAPQGTLSPLVYPLTQLLLGAARLVPTPRYFPIRLRLIRALNRLGQATGVYIPVSPLLLEMLQWSELRRTPTGGAAAAPDMLLLLRLSKTQLKMASLQEEVVSQVLELLADHLRQWATHIAFPEAAHLPCVALRGFAKGCAVERFRRSAKQLVDALERNIVYVGGARDSVAFAPQDLAAAGRFMSEDRDKAKSPLVSFAGQLLQKAAARMAMRSSSTSELKLGGEAGSKRKRKQQQEEEDDDDDEEDDYEEEDGGLGKLVAAGDASDDDADDEVLAGAAKRMMRQKEKRLKRAGAAAAAAGGSDGEGDDEGAAEDQLQEYQLSDDDEDSDEAAAAAAGGDDSDSGSEGAEGGSESDSEEDEGAGGGSRGGGGGRGQQQRGRGRGRGQHAGRGGRHGGGSGGGRGGGGRGFKHGDGKQQQHSGGVRKKHGGGRGGKPQRR